ncbi:dihydroneopterin aldolase [Aquabacterium sp. OR-4]|uniref:dihydroneopterin aldolase n=1 Tax=Aquabacterium sp. OR-4 TaxID=2978127 RepID=UPI0028C92948|nr:dihydroneopterin aldolase [Aquabacterium sp. OR-4]MDT7838284.1 dihydroneopterin aldolase [Aquabacterium sp. OR-4]
MTPHWSDQNAWPAPGSPRADTAPATGRALDLIFIDGLLGQTVIGIHPSELHAPQPLRIDLQAGLPRALACDTDRIADTIDYGEVRERLLRLLAEHRLQLLEALAEQMASILIEEFHAAWVRVRVTKPRKFADVEAVGVQIERQASRRAGGHEGPGARQAAVLRLLGSGLVPGQR